MVSFHPSLTIVETSTSSWFRPSKLKGSTGSIEGGETILPDTVRVETGHCTFIKTHQKYNTE